MKRIAILLLALGCLIPWSSAQTPPSGTLARPADAPTGTVIVPDRFLRSWDPVTIFFDRDLGGGPGDPEDHPEQFVTLEPDHPGAYTWIDSQTLQFRPADAWSPLERFTWTARGRRFELTTLMASPIETHPVAGTEGLDPVESITLRFNEPIDPVDLARMVTIELRPLPGIGSRGARWLSSQDFEVKVMERNSAGDRASYVLVLETPIPQATHATVHLRLSLDDNTQRSFAEYNFATAEPFRVVAVGSVASRFPVTADGSLYTKDQAINAGSSSRTVVVEFSSSPEAISPVEGRSLVRFTPAVDDLEFRLAGRTLEVSGGFEWDTLYQIAITPSPLRDRNGRALEVRGPSEVFLYFPRRPAYLRWRTGQGVTERFGPKMVPIDGRGHERFDMRLYPVDPLDRSFWPFPGSPVSIDESQRPPGPGEDPEPWAAMRHIREPELRRFLSALGSPPISSIVDLPLRREGSAASFGLDVADSLQRLTGNTTTPGHYILGLRSLDAGTNRQWMRLQVTDLCLTTVEESHAVRFVVTSLNTGKPVPGASVQLEGARGREWVTVFSGATDSEGAFRWTPSRASDSRTRVLRIVVRHGADLLVLDPTQPPDGFSDNTWTATGNTWLQWTTEPTGWRGPHSEVVSHVFTERPVYRPEEPVHIKGYVRHRDQGRLSLAGLSKPTVIVEGPGDLVWRFPVEVSDQGSFYWKFVADDRPTGEYQAYLEAYDFMSERVTFKLEAYRLPRFEVDIHSPDRVPLDRPFDVSMTATYYAGGNVADRPVRWRVTQFPYTWRPKAEEGYVFSSDGRFSRTSRFESTASLDREDHTDPEGAAAISLDPTIEPTAQPRTYVVEATVTGADDQTVTATRRVLALPPFVLGLKVPRYVERAAQIEPEIIVLDLDNEMLAGQALTVRLLHRQWHSYLRASDFSNGEARYITDIVDEEVFTTEITSSDEPVATTL
ncbi:MAG: alpha-2-macroglobulin, partial [bacterium]|nr:alpha-2-macroglobulin [bacterium]